MNLPVRKCYYAGKLAILIIIVVSLLSGFERWRGGRRSARAQFLDPMEEEYEREILEDEARIIPGLGEGGVAAHLVGEAKRLGEQSEKELAINVYLSDRIAYNRTLKDQRNPACARVLHDAQLPSASVVVIFHNEPLSVLLRTVWSVLASARRDRPWYRRARRNTGPLGYAGQEPGSPFVYLKEIILVDDNSTLPELRGRLSHYVRTRLPPGLVRLVRLPDRVGLTQARLAGARFAAGEVLVFLDAHCEAQEDWLRPLLQRVKEAPHAIAVPIIDVIEASNFYYSVQDPASFQGLMRARTRGARLARGDVLLFLDAHCEAGADWLRPLLQRLRWQPTAVVTPLIDVIDQSTFRLDAAEQFQVGGFTFNGHFTWVDVPEREKKRRGSDISPTWSPTMAGGLFAIRRDYFWELGGYDEQMAGWGGENLEMSFRVWQCGGTLETIPCSRVGHVFRSFHPYGLPAHTDTHGINTARMAEVWMDDYAELFYLNRPDLRNSPKIGDVTHRRVLREKLKCKSFQWYLDTVYPEKFVPVRDVEGYGRFRNPASGLCLDTLQRDAEASPLGLYPCHAALQPTQHLALSAAGELRDEERCAELPFVRGKLEAGGGRPVLMMSCHGKQRGQKWRRLSDGRIQHAAAGLCLRAGAAGGDVLAARCELAPAQRWELDYTRENNFGVDDGVELTEQQARLQRLRGVRRVSRSLLSEPRRAHRKRRPHAAHAGRAAHAARGRRKDKFVLQLVRGAQHLEAELFCRHRRLLPNDSFVRDLVAVLNDRDIKVINNGRVFEKNKVTELAKHRELKVLEKLVLQPPTPAAPAPADQVNEWESPDKMSEPGPDPVQPVQPVQVVEPVQPARAGQAGRGAARAAPPAPPPPAERKIIVEDFVEVKPKMEATGAPKRAHRKRKRGHARGAGRGAAPPLVMQQLPSAEDAPLLSAELRKRADDSPPEEPTHEKRARARTSYPHDTAHVYAEIEADARADGQGEARGEGHALAHSSRKEGDGRGEAGGDTREHSQGESREDARGDRQGEGQEDRQGEGQDESAETQAGARARARAAPPVKLVMRSNLTFNLGDEFFDWKRAADDVAGLLGELAIPAASAEALRGASAAGEAPEARGETVLTGRGLPTSDGSSKEASGSSASASAEAPRR